MQVIYSYNNQEVAIILAVLSVIIITVSIPVVGLLYFTRFKYNIIAVYVIQLLTALIVGTVPAMSSLMHMIYDTLHIYF
jgi:hypothetical protein